MNIENLLKKSESKTLEFKRDLSSQKGILHTLIAFANTAGGVLLIGIEDKSKNIIGTSKPLEMEEKLANLISDCIEPKIIPEIEVKTFRNRNILTVQIFPSALKPHYLKTSGVGNGTYIRVGSTNRLADEIIIDELKSSLSRETFDEQPFPQLSSEALNFRVASELFKSIKKITKTDLEALGLIIIYQNHKVPTVGGVILFCDEREKYFPDAWIKVGRFSGVTKKHIADSHDINSFPVLAIEEVMQFVKKHAMHSILIPGSTSTSSSASGPKIASVSRTRKNINAQSLSRHEERWNIPLVAVREAIINAVVHADYRQKGFPIRLAIFDDRIEIDNPGLLLFGMTVEDIKSGASKLRNRVIGKIFYRLGLIEQWGSGVRRIIDVCEEMGLAEPLFEELGTHFRVTIFTQRQRKPIVDDMETKILAALKSSDGLSTSKIAGIIKLSVRATRSRLISLIEKNLVVEIGYGPKDPLRKYYLKKKT